MKEEPQIKQTFLFRGEFDLGFLKEYNGFTGFMVLIDCFTHFCWTESIKTKKKGDVINALKKILKRSGQFDKLQCDGELLFTENVLKERNIYLITKRKSSHAWMVEGAIRNIKRKLFYIMRQKKSENWPEFLQCKFLIIDGFYKKMSLLQCD